MIEELTVFPLEGSPMDGIQAVAGVSSGVSVRLSESLMQTEIWHDRKPGELRNADRFALRVLAMLQAARHAIVGNRINDPGAMGATSHEQFTLTGSAPTEEGEEIVGPFVATAYMTRTGMPLIMFTHTDELVMESVGNSIVAFADVPSQAIRNGDPEEGDDEQQ